MEEYVTLPEAARRLGITRAVLWRHVKAGRLAFERVGKWYLIAEPELERFANTPRPPGRPRRQPD